jgi:IS30 family transposase
MAIRVSIDDRPASVNDRSRLGDWEVDTIIDCGPQQALVSLTEHRSRLTLLPKVVQKTADQVRDAVRGLLAPLTSTGYCQLKENSTLNRQIAWRQFLDLAGITLCTPHVQLATSCLS